MTRGLRLLLGSALPLVALVATDGRSRSNDTPTRTPTFVHDVLPILQREGCSSAYCHGGATGKGGFKLSLFGGDPEADWRALVVDLDGRRLDFAEPDQSLLLRKASQAMPHGGGRRLTKDSHGFAILRTWVAAGAPSGEGSAHLRELRLERAPTANGEDSERVRVVARFDSGESRDVTELAVLASTDPRVADVDRSGVIRAVGPGETFVSARYAGADAVLQIVRPLGAPTPPTTRTTHALDIAWTTHLSALGLTPAATAPPHVLGRRLHLDLAGRLPSVDAARRFLTDPDTAAAETIDALLMDDAFVERFATHLADWFSVPADAAALRAQFREIVAANVPLDGLVERMLRPGHALIERHGDPRDRAEFVASAFLGLRISCARCHDHPLDRWRQGDHLGLSALLATRRTPDGRVVAGAAYDDEGRPATPRLLPLAGAAPDDLDAFASVRWLALAGTDSFARVVANRLLGLLLGRAPVEPVDDLRPTNPARMGGMLDAVVAEYRRTGGDLRALVRFVVTSDAYRATSAPRDDGGDDGADGDVGDALASAHGARRTASEVPIRTWLDATAVALGVPRPDVEIPPSPLARRLLLRNGVFDAAVVGAGAACRSITTALRTDGVDAALEAAFLRLLSRLPTANERAALTPSLTAAAADTATDTARTAVVDLLRALIATREHGSSR